MRIFVRRGGYFRKGISKFLSDFLDTFRSHSSTPDEDCSTNTAQEAR
jgi:hypothetical protein